MRNWDLKLEMFDIDKHRYRELRSCCLQYPQWRDELKYKTDTLKSPGLDGMPKSAGISDATGDMAVRRMELQRKCQMIEESAKEAAGNGLSEYILENVTHEDKGYNYLKMIMGMPAEKATFYRARRKFFNVLDKKHKIG